MDDRTARMFSALGVLVVVWIVVYWSWPVSDPGVSTSMSDVDLETPPLITAPVSADVTPEGPRPVLTRPRSEPQAEQSDISAATREGVDRPGGIIPPEFNDYTVRDGDNYDRISRRVFGTTRHAMAIARSNPLQDPQKLRVGQIIRVPVDPSNIQGRAVGEQDPPPAPESATIEYTVKSGDTLSGIAKAFYGSTLHTNYLYESNRGRLRSKHDLRLGQVLLIPPLPTGAGAGED